MKDALKLGSRLHRDISIGNIILVREKDRPIRRGYLIDWDASYSVDDSGVSMAPGRAVRHSPQILRYGTVSSPLSGDVVIHVTGYASPEWARKEADYSG